MTNVTMLLDGDVIAYQISAISEVATNWGDDNWTLHADAESARGLIKRRIGTLMEDTSSTHVVVALSDPGKNFRKDVLPSYKGNRVATRKPMILNEMKEFMADEYKTFIRPSLEGDDVLGILMTSNKIVPGIKVCVSIDKDMKTIPGTHYDDGKQEMFDVSEAEANYWHLLQTLMGDATDGYKGCPGVGPKGAAKILEPFCSRVDGGGFEAFDDAEAWSAILDAYDKEGLNEAEALIQARCARILRASDYNFKRKEPILWEPK